MDIKYVRPCASELKVSKLYSAYESITIDLILRCKQQMAVKFKIRTPLDITQMTSGILFDVVLIRPSMTMPCYKTSAEKTSPFP